MTASVEENKSNTQEVKNERFEYQNTQEVKMNAI